LSTGVGQRIKSNAFSKEATWERRRRPIRRDLAFHPQTKDQDEEKKKVAQRHLQGGEWHPQMSSSSAPVNRAGISPATMGGCSVLDMGGSCPTQFLISLYYHKPMSDLPPLRK
jgi:hypothetical protein